MMLISLYNACPSCNPFPPMQKSLGPLSDNIEFATSRLAALGDPHGLDPLQGEWCTCQQRSETRAPRDMMQQAWCWWMQRAAWTACPYVFELGSFRVAECLLHSCSCKHSNH
eukprot:1144196-Pelagomonas_calceolata.AAC.7